MVVHSLSSSPAIRPSLGSSENRATNSARFASRQSSLARSKSMPCFCLLASLLAGSDSNSTLVFYLYLLARQYGISIQNRVALRDKALPTTAPAAQASQTTKYQELLPAPFDSPDLRGNGSVTFRREENIAPKPASLKWRKVLLGDESVRLSFLG